MNTFHRCKIQLPQPALLRRAAIALLLSAALASGPTGFCGPIHKAARDGDLAKVRLLLKDHPDLVSSKDEEYGQTPLHVSAFNDRLDVAKLLLADKADVNAKANNGSTPLHLAAAKGNKDMVELLLANKADINAVDNDGWSPLHSAVVWDQKRHSGFVAPARRSGTSRSQAACEGPFRTGRRKNSAHGDWKGRPFHRLR